MKKSYKIIGIILIVEFVVISYMKSCGIKAQGFWANAIGMLMVLLPILTLLKLLSKDMDIGETERNICNVGFYFWIVCYVIGAIAKFLSAY